MFFVTQTCCMNEKDLCLTLGFSRENLKEIRAKFEEGVHYVRIESRKPKHLWSVEWTDAGVDALRDELGLQPKKADEVEKPKAVTGTVHAKFKNPRILGVMVEGRTHNVLCRDSAKFGIGMDVELKWDGLRWCVSKHPRFSGKY